MSKKKTSKKGEIKMIEENIETVVEEVVDTVVEAVVEPVVEEIVEAVVEPVVEEVIKSTNPEIEPVVEEVVETVVEPVVEETNTGAVAPGIVTGCGQLNVRENPSKDAKVVCVVAKGNEVQIDLDNSTEDFYKVCASGKEGYCMKQFINIK